MTARKFYFDNETMVKFRFKRAMNKIRKKHWGKIIMSQITFQQLKEHYDKAKKYKELQLLSEGLNKFHSEVLKNSLDNQIAKKVSDDIKQLDMKLKKIKDELEVSENDIESFLLCIKDEITASIIKMHYCYALAWNEIAYIT